MQQDTASVLGLTPQGELKTKIQENSAAASANRRQRRDRVVLAHSMEEVWDKVKVGAHQAAEATKVAATKAKLRAEMMMIDRDITSRKHKMGIEMYDFVSPMAQSIDFFAANDELTNILRPPLIKAQKEIQALAGKRVTLKEEQGQAEIRRAAAFPTPAETIGEKLKNAGKSTVMAGTETKIKAELAIVDMKIKNYKQQFGLELYFMLSEAEDSRGYIPSDRNVRSIYDQTRKDITELENKKSAKQQELEALGGGKNGDHGALQNHSNLSDALNSDDVGNNNSNSNVGGSGGSYRDSGMREDSDLLDDI